MTEVGHSLTPQERASRNFEPNIPLKRKEPPTGHPTVLEDLNLSQSLDQPSLLPSYAPATTRQSLLLRSHGIKVEEAFL